MRNADMSGANEIPKNVILKRSIKVSVCVAGRSSMLTGTARENIARGRVICRRIRKEVLTVSDKEKYLNVLALLVSMRSRGVISALDFNKAERYITKKYCIKKGSIYRPNDLINFLF